jgi:hypothetical protein
LSVDLDGLSMTLGLVFSIVLAEGFSKTFEGLGEGLARDFAGLTIDF